MRKTSHIWFREQIKMLLVCGETEKATETAFCYAVAMDLGSKHVCPTTNELPDRVNKILSEIQNGLTDTEN